MTDSTDIKRRLHDRTAQLCEPRNYFSGVSGHVATDPDNILLMRRDSAFPVTRGADAENLFHKRYALTVNLATDGLVCINEKTFPLPVGYATLVYPFQTHHYMVDQHDFNWLIITFELARVWPTELMYRSTCISGHSFLLLDRITELYVELRGKPESGRAALLQHYLACFLMELAEEPKRIDADSHPPAADRRVRLFEEINGYIFKKLSDPTLSLEEIAGKHYISVSFLYMLFNSLAGWNPGEYIRNCRISQAIKLLDGRELLISEIADRVGFSSLPIFSRCFRRVVGRSPSDYLRQRGGGDRE